MNFIRTIQIRAFYHLFQSMEIVWMPTYMKVGQNEVMKWTRNTNPRAGTSIINTGRYQIQASLTPCKVASGMLLQWQWLIPMRQIINVIFLPVKYNLDERYLLFPIFKAWIWSKTNSNVKWELDLILVYRVGPSKQFHLSVKIWRVIR